jgi:hypothetical protein
VSSNPSTTKKKGRKGGRGKKRKKKGEIVWTGVLVHACNFKVRPSKS